MTPNDLIKLHEIYAGLIISKGFKTEKHQNHGHHIDTMFKNKAGGLFGLRVEVSQASGHPMEHHLSCQVHKVATAGNPLLDTFVKTPQEGIEFLRHIFGG